MGYYFYYYESGCNFITATFIDLLWPKILCFNYSIEQRICLPNRKQQLSALMTTGEGGSRPRSSSESDSCNSFMLKVSVRVCLVSLAWAPIEKKVISSSLKQKTIHSEIGRVDWNTYLQAPSICQGSRFFLPWGSIYFEETIYWWKFVMK
jgi:hypothetical protein